MSASTIISAQDEHLPTIRSLPPILSDFSDFNKDFWATPEKSAYIPPRTKIIATIGPASDSPSKIKELLDAGMNVARLNFSHGDHDYHRRTIHTIRNVEAETRKLCAIMLDTQGPEIRTGLVKNSKVEIFTGQKITIRTSNIAEDFVGDASQISIKYAKLAQILKKGSTILIDDGLIELEVTQICDNSDIVCLIKHDAVLGSKKGVSLPGVVLDLPAPTQKDVEDIKFGVSMNVDFIAASFVRKVGDIKTIREILGKRGKSTKIIAKIENQEGLQNFDEILTASDGIMVARGDLGVAIPIEHITLAQKLMIRKCNAAGKVVVTATQMLESMCHNPTPTRAEASDVENAVFDGTDCVMLSGETAKGSYPVESIKIMADICRESERSVNYHATFRYLHDQRRSSSSSMSIGEAIASSAVKTAVDLKASIIIVMSYSSQTPRLVAKYRPKVPILMITDSEKYARQGLVSRGVIPLLVGSISGETTLITRVISVAKKLGMCRIGDVAVVVMDSRNSSLPPHLRSAALTHSQQPRDSSGNNNNSTGDNLNVIQVMRVAF